MKTATNIEELYELQRNVEGIRYNKKPYQKNNEQETKKMFSNDLDTEYLYYEPRRPFLRLVR